MIRMLKSLVLALLVVSGAGFPRAMAGQAGTLSPEINSRMKSGRKLDRVWLNPTFDASTGFTLGRVESWAEGRLAGKVDYFRQALSRLALPDSAQVLDVTVLNLYAMEAHGTGRANASMEVEGQILDKDGQVMFAFATQQEVDNRESAETDCEAVMDSIAWSVAKELGEPLARAYLARARADAEQQTLLGKGGTQARTPESQSAGGAALAPAPPSRNLSTAERLFHLQQLLKIGMITREQYEKKRTRYPGRALGACPRNRRPRDGGTGLGQTRKVPKEV